MSSLLMCPPDHFGVDYAINPWMADNVGAVDREAARRQWEALAESLASAGAKIETLTPVEGLPDLPFTSNGGFVSGHHFYPSRFRHEERRPETEVFVRWFAAHGWCIEPTVAIQEGAGDFLPWRCDGGECLFAGGGFRTSAAAHAEMAEALDIEIVPLTLIDPRFPHLDACFRPLSGGLLLWVPFAFDRESRERVEAHVPPPLRHSLGCCEALCFAANGVVVGDRYFTSAADRTTQSWLASAGLETVVLDVSEFLKAGGGVGALVLAL
ncbi:hypothetical protein BH11ARM2_BH11ARM2_35710 [soil metagenome]